MVVYHTKRTRSIILVLAPMQMTLMLPPTQPPISAYKQTKSQPSANGPTSLLTIKNVESLGACSTLGREREVPRDGTRTSASDSNWKGKYIY
jgi:hypothetical protein